MRQQPRGRATGNLAVKINVRFRKHINPRLVSSRLLVVTKLRCHTAREYQVPHQQRTRKRARDNIPARDNSSAVMTITTEHGRRFKRLSRRELPAPRPPPLPPRSRTSRKRYLLRLFGGAHITRGWRLRTNHVANKFMEKTSTNLLATLFIYGRFS